MPGISETKEDQKLSEAVVSTLVFFSMYHLPLSAKRVSELVLGLKASPDEIEQSLAELVSTKRIVQVGNLYSVKPWDASAYNANQLELTKKWAKIDRYFSWLSVLPFVRGLSVINSLALGTADSDSDIDFFVITKNNRLYAVRSMIIVLFRLLGVYKTRQRIKDKFCFGFFVTENSLELGSLQLAEDPYFVFWLASMRPILGRRVYWQLMQANQWLKDFFPNFQPEQRMVTVTKANPFIQLVKFGLEVLLWLPATLVEPLLRRIHINHTFKLAENNTQTSTTIATANMLKLHAYDVRAEVAEAYQKVLNSL